MTSDLCHSMEGTYLSVVDVAKAVLRTGARCWLTMEVFDGGEDGKGGMKYDLREFAKKGDGESYEAY